MVARDLANANQLSPTSQHVKSPTVGESSPNFDPYQSELHNSDKFYYCHNQLHYYEKTGLWPPGWGPSDYVVEETAIGAQNNEQARASSHLLTQAFS